jgi:hypothetical protein
MMPALHRTIARVLVVGVLPLFIVRAGGAQTSVPRFAGNWLEDWPGTAGAPTTPRLIRVTVDAAATTIAVEEGQGNSRQPRHPPNIYRLDPQSVDVRASTDHTFRLLASDRLEVHEITVSPRGAQTAVLAVWELKEGGRVLRIRRLFRPLDGTNAAHPVRVSTYHRADN